MRSKMKTKRFRKLTGMCFAAAVLTYTISYNEDMEMVGFLIK